MTADKELMASRFSKAIKTYADNASVQGRIASEMLCQLDGHILPPGESIPDLSGGGGRCPAGKVLEIGCGTGNFTRLFLSEYSPESMWLNDICPGYEASLADLLDRRVRFMPGDAESIALPRGMDMIVSCSAFQWFHDTGSFLSRAVSCMERNGILAFSTFGRENLSEISALEGGKLNYHTMGELVDMLPPGMELLSAREATMVLHFEDALSVLRHLKNTGVTGVRSEFWTRGRLAGFERRYRERFSTEDGLTLTYHPIWIIARKSR